MIARIKAFWGAVHDVLLYILTPILFLAGMLAYALGDRDRWKRKFEATERDEKTNRILEEKDRATKDADTAEREFRDALDELAESRKGKTDV